MKRIEITKTMIGLILLVILNIIIKGLFISNNSIGGDEPFSIYHAQMDIISIIDQLSSGNNPPLYEIILHFWIRVFGISEIAVRFPSLLFSSITVIFIYKIGDEFLSKKIAIFSSLLFIFSNYQVIYAHEARVYTLFALLTSISMFYFLKAFTIRQPKRKLIYLITANILLIYSHYFGFFVIFIQVFVFLINKELRNNYWKQMLLMLGIITLFYLPNINVVISRFFDSSSNGTWVKPPKGIYSIIDILRAFNNEEYGSQTIFGSKPILTGFLLLLVLFGSIKFFYQGLRIKNNFKKQYLIFSFAIPFVIMFLLSYKVPMFLDRYLIFTTIGYYFLIAILFDFLFKKPLIQNIMGSLFLIGMVWTTNPNISNKRNVKETVAKIKELENSNTLILLSPDHFILNFAYYYDIEIFKHVYPDDLYKKMSDDFSHKNIYGINHINQVNYRKWENVVYLDAAADFSYPNNNIKGTLDKEYTLMNKTNIYEIFVIYEYVLNKSEKMNP